MNNEKNLSRLSKFMSLVLRHQPEVAGLQPDANGWVEIDSLLKGMKANDIEMDKLVLDEVVRTNDKQRFEIHESGKFIRARQGHSINVDLGLDEKIPPEILFHGTVKKFVPEIMEGGLKKMSRHHVHLSETIETAVAVGDRRGQALILKIRAKEMRDHGHAFYLSSNQVWLTDHVPPEFIDFPD